MLKAAGDEQVALATVRQAIATTDKAWVISGQTVGQILTKQARDTGFSTTEIAQSFLRLETGTRSTTKSLALLNLAEDVSRGRHIELAQAAGLLARAQQGSYNALRRIGIVIPPVTKNVDELKKQHLQAVEAGVKFTASQNAAYKAALVAAAALDAQATKVNVIAQVQARFAGQTKTFAGTAAGGYARLREEIRQFEASVGRDLLPTLSRGVSGLIQWVDGLRQSENVHRAVTSTIEAFAAGFHTVKSAVELVSPPLRIVARLVGEIGSFTGGISSLLGFAAAFKGISLVVGLAETAQKKYQHALALGRGEQTALATATSRDAASYNALTAAVERDSIALAANTAAAERAALVQRASGGGVALAGVGSAFQAVGAGAAAGATETAAAAEKVKEGFIASSEAVVGFTADSAVLADVTRHTAKDLGEYERGALGVSKGLGEATASQTRYGRSQSGSNAEQLASATTARKSSIAYRDLSASVDGSAASLNANAAAAGRSAAALESGTVATITRVGTSYQTLGAAGAQGALAIQQLDTATQGASGGLLATSNQVASTAHHSQQLQQSFVNAGAGAKALATDVGAVGAAEAKQALGAKAVAESSGVATVATIRQMKATEALAAVTVRYNAIWSAAARASGPRAAQLGNTLITDQRRADALQVATFKARVAAMRASQAFNPPQTQRVGTTPEFQIAQAKILANVQARYRAEAAALGQSVRLTAVETKGASLALAGFTAGLAGAAAPQAAATVATRKEAVAYDGLAVSTERAAAAQVTFTTASVGVAGASAGASIAQTGAGLDRLAKSQLALGSTTKNLGGANTVTTRSARALAGEIEKTAVKATGLGAILKSLGRGLFEMAGGMRTVGLVGAAVLAFAIYKVVTAESDLEKATKRLSKSLGDLSGDFAGVADSAKKYADAISAAKTDKIARAEAALSAARARQNLIALAGKEGTAEYAEALLALKRANDEYRLSIGRVSQDEAAAATARRAGIDAHIKLEHDRQVALKDTLKLLEAAKASEFKSAAIRGPKPEAVQQTGGTLREQAKAADRFADSLHKISEANKEAHPFFARQVQDFDLFVRTLHRVPSAKVISIFVRTGSAKATLEGIIAELAKTTRSIPETIAQFNAFAASISGTDPALSKRIRLLVETQKALGDIALTPRQFDLILNAKDFRSGIAAADGLIRHLKDPAGKAGGQAGADFAAAFALQLKNAGLIKDVREGLGSVLDESGKVIKAVSEAALANAKVQVAAARTSLRDQRSLVASATQAARDAGRQVADAQRSLADAIRSGAQSVRDSVASAQQNLASIGQSLNDTVDQFLDATKKTDALIGPSAKQFKDLKAQLAAGASGSDLAASARALTNQIDEQQVVEGDAADKRKERSRRQINDLVIQLDKGIITVGTFNKRVAAVLAADGITYKKAGTKLGFAFAEGFRAQVKGLAAQALAISQGPHFKTTGLEPSIVKPLEAVRDAQRQIKDAQQSLADSLRGQAKADKELAAAQAKLPGIVAQAARVQRKLEDLEAQEAKFELLRAKRLAAAQKAENLQGGLGAGSIWAEHGGRSVGADFGKGAQKGIAEAERGLVLAVETLVDRILGTFRKKTKSHSPSEETRLIGGDLGLGLGHGIRDSKSFVEGAASDLAGSAIRGMKLADDLFAQHAKHSVNFKVIADLREASLQIDGFGRAAHHARLKVGADVRPAAAALDALHAREAKRNLLHLQVGIKESQANTQPPPVAPLIDRGVPAALEGKPHDRVMLAEALAHKRILASQERHLGNLVQESRRQTALLHHRKPIPKPKRSGAAISGARLAAVAE